MVIGDCPYADCDEGFMIAVPEHTPAFSRHECEKCKRVIWTRLSRLDPWSMTEPDFLSAYTVDDDTKRITKRSESH